MSGDVIHIRPDGEPTKPNRSVGQLAKHLGISFAPGDLQLSMVALARKVESLQFEVELLRHQTRPLMTKLRDVFSRSDKHEAR